MKIKVKAKSQQNKSENVNESSQQYEFLDYTADVSQEQTKDVVYETAAPDDSYFSSAECAELEETSFDFNKKKKMESLEKEIVLLEDVYETETKKKNTIPWRNYVVYLLIITSLSCCVTFSKYVSEVRPSGVARAADFHFSVYEDTSEIIEWGDANISRTQKTYEFDPGDVQEYTIIIENKALVPVEVYINLYGVNVSDESVGPQLIDTTYTGNSLNHKISFKWEGETDFTYFKDNGARTTSQKLNYCNADGDSISLTIRIEHAGMTTTEYAKFMVNSIQIDGDTYNNVDDPGGSGETTTAPQVQDYTSAEDIINLTGVYERFSSANMSSDTLTKVGDVYKYTIKNKSEKTAGDYSYYNYYKYLSGGSSLIIGSYDGPGIWQNLDDPGSYTIAEDTANEIIDRLNATCLNDLVQTQKSDWPTTDGNNVSCYEFTISTNTILTEGWYYFTEGQGANVSGQQYSWYFMYLEANDNASTYNGKPVVMVGSENYTIAVYSQDWAISYFEYHRRTF